MQSPLKHAAPHGNGAKRRASSGDQPATCKDTAKTQFFESLPSKVKIDTTICGRILQHTEILKLWGLSRNRMKNCRKSRSQPRTQASQNRQCRRRRQSSKRKATPLLTYLLSLFLLRKLTTNSNLKNKLEEVL